MEVIKDMSVLN